MSYIVEHNDLIKVLSNGVVDIIDTRGAWKLQNKKKRVDAFLIFYSLMSRASDEITASENFWGFSLRHWDRSQRRC